MKIESQRQSLEADKQLSWKAGRPSELQSSNSVLCRPLSCLGGLSEFFEGQIAHRAVWSMIVVVLTPRFNIVSGIVQSRGPVFVQTRGAKTAVEGLDERVIRGFPRSVEVQGDLAGMRPLIRRLRCNFRAIVHADRFRA